MSMFLRLPSEIMQFSNYPGYFVTYFGDIYHGVIFDHHKFPDRIFIVPKINIHEWNKLDGNATIEQLNDLGWEIRDIRIITKILDGNIQIGDNSDIPDYGFEGDQIRQMFVFGAGASSYCVSDSVWDSFQAHPYSPPLGNELFNKKFEPFYKKYRGARLSLPGVKQAKDDVEGFYESEWLLFRDAYNPGIIARHISILYYLHDLFCAVSSDMTNSFFEDNLLAFLADKLQKILSQQENRKIALVSFNYDTILDTFLTQYFGKEFNQLDDYLETKSKPFELYKPHGSCNWGWRFKPEIFDKTNRSLHEYLYDNQITFDEIYYDLIGNYNEMVLGRSWGIDSDINKRRNKFSPNRNRVEVIKSDSNNYFPSLLIPYRDKDEFLMPYHHSLSLRNRLNGIEDLFLIGWKGNEAFFNKLLEKEARRLKRLIIVNPKPDEVLLNTNLQVLNPEIQIIKYPSLAEFAKVIDSEINLSNRENR